MKLSLFRDSYRNIQSDETIDSWDDFVDLVTVSTKGQKDGDYFIRGFCDGDRSDKNMAIADIIIIDGDQTLTNVGSCEPMLSVYNVMKGAGITHVIYTSFSNDPLNNRNKWRLCVPCDGLVDSDTSRQGVAEIISILHENGLNVRNVSENNTMSQPWFLPRFSTVEQEANFDFRSFDGEKYELTAKISDSAHYSVTPDGEQRDGGPIFNWNVVYEQFSGGTLHIGLRSAIGWLIYTTDWADAQIKQHLIGLVERLCPDKEKVRRATSTTEIDQLIKFCRQKSGVDIPTLTNWKDDFISFADLKDEQFPDIVWAVKDLVPEGLTILSGDPKAGKSLLALDLCLSVALGQKAMGYQECEKGSSVYLALEDPRRRVHSRTKTQEDQWPENAYLITRGVPKIGVDFFKMLDEMVLLMPDLRLVVVDVLKMVMPARKANVSEYDYVYEIMPALASWAQNHHVAVIMVTHNNKGSGSDSGNAFSKIMGSTGYQGTADSMLVLELNPKKGQHKTDVEVHDGSLHITGRDLVGGKEKLEFDSESVRWCLQHEISQETTKQPSRLLILDFLKKATKYCKPKEISVGARVNYATTKKTLERLLKIGAVEQKDRGMYKVPGNDFVADEWT